MSIITRAEALEAENSARQQRKGFMGWLQADPSKGDHETLKLMLHASKGDVFKFDELIAHHKVAALFRAGALFFSNPTSI